MVPREGRWGEYYAATEAKHLGDRTQPGSKFLDTELKTLDDVLALAQKQRGSLEGDDREIFLAEGASPESFNPNFRYLRIRTPGTVGVKHSKGLPDTTIVEIVRTKPGGPCSVVHDVDEQPYTDTGVIVLAHDNTGAVPTGGDILITAFPGPIVPPSTSALDAFEGQQLSLGQVRAVVGDVWMNTRVRGSHFST